MRRFTAVLLALILSLGFTLALAPDANAKTAILGYGSVSVAPNGPYGSWEFTGQPAFGAGLRFGTGGRFSFGLDYMGQKMTGGTSRYVAYTGKDAIELANFYERNISQYNITPEMLLAYGDNSETGLFNIVTGALYISLLPENASQTMFEPVFGIVAGTSIAEQRVDRVNFYHRDLDDVLGYHFQFAAGNGRESVRNSVKFLAGMSFGLNILPVQNLLIAPEIRWLYGNGLNVRIGTGVAF